MADVSRRFFLIGSAAALVATQLPAFVPEQAIARGALSPRFAYRLIDSFSITAQSAVNKCVAVALKRGDNVLMQTGINAYGGAYYWKAFDPAWQLIMLPDQALTWECEPGLDGLCIDLISNMEFRVGMEPRLFAEGLEFRDGKFVEALYGPAPLAVEDRDWVQPPFAEAVAFNAKPENIVRAVELSLQRVKEREAAAKEREEALAHEIEYEPWDTGYP